MKKENIKIENNKVYQKVCGVWCFDKLLKGNFKPNNSGYHNKFIKRG